MGGLRHCLQWVGGWNDVWFQLFRTWLQLFARVMRILRQRDASTTYARHAAIKCAHVYAHEHMHIHYVYTLCVHTHLCTCTCTSNLHTPPHIEMRERQTADGHVRVYVEAGTGS